MIKLKIDNKEIEVPVGTSVLKAAESLGITIPSMCFKEGYSNHPSCMVCMVKDANTNKLFPSCAMPVSEGMNIITDDDEVKNSRKDALELLMSDHVGDCEAPCRVACPAFMNIPKMNRLIAAGKFEEALIIVKEEIAIPLVLGYVCTAPCEKVCRRKDVDQPVSICKLKRFVAEEETEKDQAYLPEKQKSSGKKIAIIGSGPSGLAAAFHTVLLGHQCTVFEKEELAGGSLREINSEHELPVSALNHEIKILVDFGVEFKLGKEINQDFFTNEIVKKYDAIILASGDILKNKLDLKELKFSEKGILADRKTYTTENPKIFACGSIITPQKMAVKAVAQGKEAAKATDAFLRGNVLQNEKIFNSRFGKLQENEVAEYLKESKVERNILKESNLQGFSMEEAILEAERCMHCDCRKVENCKLRNFSEEYKIDRKKYSFSERNQVIKYMNHETVVYEPEKCIRCSLCIDITNKNGETTGLTAIGRGFDVRVKVPFNDELANAITKSAEECVKSCPTGALSFKN